MGARDIDEGLLDAAELVRDALREYLAPPPRITVTQWAELHRRLSAKDSSEPGPYRVSRTPYAREPQDCLSVHSPVEEVVLMWGAQTSKTTIGSNWLGYLADINPGPVMIVQPTIDTAKRYSRQRLTPMIDESPRLRERIRANRSRDDANTTLLKEFSGGFMLLAGANSAAGLRSMPVRDLFLDEVDAYPADVDGEGDPCKLAEARQTTFARRKRLKTSTPTESDVSRIQAAYLASDRCRYHVPCPHCGELQALEWGADKPYGVKWDRDDEGAPIPATVRYVCRHNGCEVREHLKPGMLADGKWVAQAPGAAGGRVRGFHLSSLYSPLGWLAWWELALEWHAAMVAARSGDASRLRAFINTRLAETFEAQGDRADRHELRKRAGDWPLRTVLPQLYVATMGVDVQGDRVEAYIWAWGRGMERQLVDRAVIHGDPALPESEEGSPWAALTEYRRSPILHPSGEPVPLLGCAIDTGHQTQAVYAYVREHDREGVRAVKGSSVAAKDIVSPAKPVEVNWRGVRIKRGVKLWTVGTDTAKTEIYGRLRLTSPGPGYVHLSRQMPEHVFEQLTAERQVTKVLKGGRKKREWVKSPSQANEALDCAVYALAMAHIVGVEKWQTGDWLKWARRVGREGQERVPAPGRSPDISPVPGGRISLAGLARGRA